MTRILARLLLLSRGVDRAYRAFDRLRSTIVLATASDAVLDEYNTITYNRTSAYRAGAADFRTGLFDWERDAIDRYFPPPPGVVLVGGAGGGREPIALIDRGYRVVAFDPAEDLVRAMNGACRGDTLRTGIGTYADLPHLRALDGSALDLRSQHFSAAIIGWASFSHLRSDADRIATLRAFGALTDGPILVSYFPDLATTPAVATTAGTDPGGTDPGGSALGWLRRRAGRRGRSVFSVQIGYYRLLTEREMDGFAREAGLSILGSATDGNFPWVVLRRA